jgi:hypothetical protein
VAEKLIIHAGFFKTGTTNLQSSLHASRETLLENNILYPVITSGSGGRITGQHRAAWALKGRVWGWENSGGTTIPIKVWKKLAKNVNQYSGTAVLSSEFLSELTDEEVSVMKADLEFKDARIVFTIRPLVKMLPSQYQQSLKYGMRLSYEEWLQRVLQGSAEFVQWRTFWLRHDHPAVIKRWVDNFGAENISLIVADENHPEFIYDSFNDLLQLPAHTLKKIESSALNRSMSWEEINLLLALNKKYNKDLGWQNYSIMVRDGYIKQLTDSPLTRDHERLLTPEWAIDLAKEITLRNIELLNGMGIEIKGDLESLATATIPSGTNVVQDKIDLDFAAEVMLSHTQSNLIKYFGFKELSEEFFRRLDNSADSRIRIVLVKILKKYLKSR